MPQAELRFFMENEEVRVLEEVERLENEELTYLEIDVSTEDVSSIEVDDEEASVLSDMIDLLEELNVPYDYKAPVLDGDTRIIIFRPKQEDQEEIRIESWVDPNSYGDDLSVDMNIRMHRVADIIEQESDDAKIVVKIKELMDEYYKIKRAGTL